jgi:hypothetical protein
MRWEGRRVSVEDAVGAPRGLSGDFLREAFFKTMSLVTCGLISTSPRALWLGPVVLFRFGDPAVTEHEVSWPIEGGGLAREPGGYLSIRSTGDALTARVTGYRPSLPRPIYALTQLHVHHTVVRLQLLHIRVRRPAAGVPAPTTRRMAAGMIDAAVCAGLALAFGRRRRIAALLGITAGYHVACWTISGRTLGGAVMRQQVVAVDRSRVTLAQAVLRLATLPLAAVRMHAVHDEVAATDVIAD